MTAAARFTQADMKRAASGVLAAGLKIAKIEIDPNGKIIIIPGDSPKTGGKNAWGDLE